MIEEHGFGVHLHHARPRDPEAAPTHAAWTAPRTWVTSELVSSTIMNTHVRDNLNAWQASARVYHSVTQSIATSTIVALACNTEAYDIGGLHDTVTNNSRLTAPLKGIYQVWANVRYANGSGQRRLFLRKNGVTDISVVSQTVAAAGDPTYMEANALYTFNVSDYVEALGWQDTGAGLNVEGIDFAMALVTPQA